MPEGDDDDQKHIVMDGEDDAIAANPRTEGGTPLQRRGPGRSKVLPLKQSRR